MKWFNKFEWKIRIGLFALLCCVSVFVFLERSSNHRLLLEKKHVIEIDGHILGLTERLGYQQAAEDSQGPLFILTGSKYYLESMNAHRILFYSLLSPRSLIRSLRIFDFQKFLVIF